MRQNPIRLHWANSKPNFGDQLSPLLCELLSGRPVQHASPQTCDLMAVGSLLQRLSERWWSRRIHIWGTGFIEQEPAHTSRHYYHALRGRLSQQIILNANPSALGDPALLAHLLLAEGPRPAKRYRIGVVPHYKDKSHPILTSLLATAKHATEIDVFLPPRQFLAALAECESVVSTAMHPLIAADALEIPNAWIQLSDRVRGQGFKFRDYYSVFGIAEPRPIELNSDLMRRGCLEIAASYSRPNLAAIQDALIQSFPFRR